jgi:apolipoprotein N-acyltransferase
MRQSFAEGRKDWLVAAVGGLLLTLSFPRYGHGLVAWVALLPLFWLGATASAGRCFKLGWLTGVCHGLSLLYWIVHVVNHYGNLPFLVSLLVCFSLVSYLALFPALFCAGLSWLRNKNLPWLLLSPALWVALELGKSRLLTGFPWENLGYSQYRFLPLIQIAEITGVYGISFVLVLVNALLFQLIPTAGSRSRPLVRTAPLLLAGGVILALLGYGSWRLRTLEHLSGQFFKVAMIQGNISQDTKWDPVFQETTMKHYMRLTAKAAQDKPDLIVWPETATPFYFLVDVDNSRALIHEIQDLATPLLFGSPAYDYQGGRLRFYNRAYLLNGLGQVTGYYDKVHLVPFGEYVPWKRVLFFVNRLVQAAGDFASGGRPGVLSSPPARLGVLICYEAIFPELSRDLVAGGANLLVNITNDAWFGRSSAPYQHLSMAVLRTVENRVPMVRCANTGISAFIDARGCILQGTKLFQTAILTDTLRLGKGQTTYCRYGDWFPLSCLVVCLLVLGAAATRRRFGR